MLASRGRGNATLGEVSFLGVGACPPSSPDKRPSSAGSRRSRISNRSTTCTSVRTSGRSTSTTVTCFTASCGPTSAEREVKAFLSNVLESGDDWPAGPAQAWQADLSPSEDEVLARATTTAASLPSSSSAASSKCSAAFEVPPDRPAVSAEACLQEYLRNSLEAQACGEDEIRSERPTERPSRQPTGEPEASAAEPAEGSGCYYLHGLTDSPTEPPRGVEAPIAAGAADARPVAPQRLSHGETGLLAEGPEEGGAVDLKAVPGWIQEDADEDANPVASVKGPLVVEAPSAAPAAAPSAASGSECRNVSAEGLVEAYMRSRLEGTSDAAALVALRQSQGRPRQRKHFDDSGDEVDYEVPSGSTSGVRTEHSSSLTSKDRERLLSQRRPSRLSLLPQLFRRHSRTKAVSIMQETLSLHDELWFGVHLLTLQRDGMVCSKVARNGDLVQRSVHIAPRAESSCLELRGGKAGTKAVRVEEITDIQRGLGSQEFRFFLQHFTKDQPSNLADRSMIVQSPGRTLSLIFPSEDLRDTLAHCILYLLGLSTPC